MAVVPVKPKKHIPNWVWVVLLLLVVAAVAAFFLLDLDGTDPGLILALP